MTQGIIILAHGSKYQDAVIQNAHAAQMLESGTGIKTLSAFMELCEPSFHTAIDTLVSEGILNITVLLMFLFEGYHTRITIPDLIKEAETRHPQACIKMSSVLSGDHIHIVDILTERFAETSTTPLQENPL